MNKLNQFLPSIRGETFTASIAQNLKAGLVVALVSMPLSISLSVAAGGTPAQGVVTAIWGGFIAGIFSSSHYNIEGPTGALSGVLSVIAIKYGTDAFPFVAIFSGVFSLVLVLFGLHKYILFLPSPVIHGFTVGVAFIIGLGQLNNAFGLHAPHIPAHPDEHFYVNVYHSFEAIGHADPSTSVVFTVSFVFLFFMTKWFPRIPWSLVAVLGGCGLGYLSSIHKYEWLKLTTLGSKYNCSPTVYLNLHWPESAPTLQLMYHAFPVSFVAILETLISARIADGMTQSYSPPRQESFANSIANIGTGLLGGIPCTAALARTALNIKSGATNRMSIIINALAVAVMGSTLLNYFEHYPLAVVASQVVLVAVRMVETHHIRNMWELDKLSFALTFFVAFLCCFQDPSTGIVIGTIIGLLRFADAVSMGHAEITLQNTNLKVSSRLRLNSIDKMNKVDLLPDDLLTNKTHWVRGWTSVKASLKKCVSCVTRDDREEYQGMEDQTQPNQNIPPQEEEVSDIMVYRIVGKLTYINAQRHQSRIQAIRTIRRVHTVVLALRYMHYVDIDGADAIGQLVSTLEAPSKADSEHSIRVAISGLQPSCEALITKSKWYKAKVNQNMVFPNFHVAVDSLAGSHARDSEEDEHQWQNDQL